MSNNILKIDVPIIDFAFMQKVIINGKEKDIGKLTKWSLILEVNHLPRIQAIYERPIEGDYKCGRCGKIVGKGFACSCTLKITSSGEECKE